jgi:hypothetical protein
MSYYKYNIDKLIKKPYSLQQAKYSELFFPMDEDKLKDYDTAAASSELYIRYFKSLLQNIESHSLDNVKRFSILPIASHQIGNYFALK